MDSKRGMISFFKVNDVYLGSSNVKKIVHRKRKLHEISQNVVEQHNKSQAEPDIQDLSLALENEEGPTMGERRNSAKTTLNAKPEKEVASPP